MSDQSSIKGSWSMSPENPVDVLEPFTTIDGNDVVIVIPLMHGQHIKSGATTFAQAFNRDDVEHAYSEALLQMALKTAGDLQLRVSQSSSEDAGLSGHAYEVYIETLLRHERDEYIADGDYGGTPDVLSARPFMRDITDDVVVDGYRIVIFIKNGIRSSSYGSLWLDNIDAIEAEYLKALNQTTRASLRGGGGGGGDGDGGGGETGVSLMSYQPGASANSKGYGRALQANEKWRLLRNRATYAKAVDVLLGVERLGNASVLARCVAKSLPHDNNLINPHYALSPLVFFEHACASIEKTQTTMSNYIVVPNSFERWRFPNTSLVLRVPHADTSIDRFMSKLLPENQVRFGANINEHLRRQRKARELRMARLFTRPRIDGAPASVLPARDMVQQQLEFGAAGDIDEFAGAGGLGDEASRVARAAFDSDSEDDGGGGGGGRASLAVGGARNRELSGGKDFASISNMVAQVPCLDESGNYRAVDAEMLQREDFEDSTSMAAQELLSSYDKSTSSAFHRLRFIGASLRSRLNDLASFSALEDGGGGVVAADTEPLSREDLRKVYLANQRTILRLYEDLCTQTTSDLMMEGRKINAWRTQRNYEKNDEWLGVDEPLFDTTLTIHGNLEARRMLQLEAFMFVTSLHLLGMTAVYGSRDAYRHRLDLHWFLMLSGGHSKGKSFVSELIQNLSIPGTVTKVDDETSAAAYADHDYNDQIFFCEEVKPDKLKTSKHGGDDNKEASFKEYMTSMVRVKRCFAKGLDGSRQARMTYSQQIATYTMCSNLDYEEFSQPIRSRMSCINVLPVRRDDRHTSDIAGIETRLPPATAALRAATIDEFCIDQFFQYHVEKLIGDYALTDVTLTAFNTIQQIFKRHLIQRSAIEPMIRTGARAAILTRKLVISHACHLLYSTPHSPYFKKPFEFRSLAALDVLLHDNEEMALRATEMLRHEIVDSARTHFIDLLYERVLNPQLARIDSEAGTIDPERQMPLIFMRPQTPIYRSTSGSDFDHDESASKAARASGVVASDISRVNSRRRSALGGGSGGGGGGGGSFDQGGIGNVQQTMAHEMYPSTYMNAYVRIDGSSRSVAERIERWSRDSPVTISSDKARHIMRRMAKQDIVSRAFDWDNVEHRPRVLKNKRFIRIPSLIYTSTAVFIAFDLFIAGDPFDAAIKYTHSKFTPYDRKYLRAVPYSAKHPQYLAVRYVKANSGLKHRTIDYANQRTAATMFATARFERANLTARDLDSGRRTLEYHYDELSARERARALFLDPDVDGADDGVCSFGPWERAARLNHVRKQTAVYPTGLMTVDDEARARAGGDVDDVFDAAASAAAMLVDKEVRSSKPIVLGDDDDDNDDDDDDGDDDEDDAPMSTEMMTVVVKRRRKTPTRSRADLASILDTVKRT